MTPTETRAAASRLCGQCGLCCNGVMFHTVNLQPTDSAKALTALGVKLKRKRGRQLILQPCPAYRGAQCSIYLSRPERCRLFECRQLKRVVAGEITEAKALERIGEAKDQVSKLNELLTRAGETNIKRALSKRCEKVAAEPASDRPAAELQSRLMRAMKRLDVLLDQEFRLESETT